MVIEYYYYVRIQANKLIRFHFQRDFHLKQENRIPDYITPGFSILIM